MIEKTVARKRSDGTTPGLPHGPIALAVVREHPGRLTGPQADESAIPPKPKAKDTPWRSSHFVPARMSADGNGYAKNEPIPEIEARRQGLVDDTEERSIGDIAAEMVVGERATKERLTAESAARLRISTEKGKFAVPYSETCLKCRGTGKRANLKGHKEGCKCVACSPCTRCDGTGKVKPEEDENV